MNTRDSGLPVPDGGPTPSAATNIEPAISGSVRTATMLTLCTVLNAFPFENFDWLS